MRPATTHDRRCRDAHRGRRGRQAALVTALAVVLTASVGCGSKAKPNELTVFAASSLKEAFEALASDFERTNPGIKVVLSFAGSQSLRTQIENGAETDVFASANADHMSALQDKGLAAPPKKFAENRLVIVVPKKNPAGIETLGDLGRAKRLVLAHPNVPAGAYSEAILGKANELYGDGFATSVIDRAVSRELNVRQTLQKVVLGEADAALVYATDAATAEGKIITIEIPPQLNVTASYPIATLNTSSRSALAKRFVAHVASDAGTTILERFGFRPAAVITAGR